MYTCKDAINLLLEFLDGEMPPEESQHLREHLSGCAPCVDFLRTYKATPGLCRRALAQKMPQEVSARLTEYLRSRIKSAS
jgi:anti-sigma factor (TIGR02949 family)